MTQTKICTKCNAEKELSEFNKSNAGKYGTRSNCKLCQAKQKAEHYQANKEKIAKQSAEYQKANKERIAKQRAGWRQANKEKVNKRNAEWIKTPRGKAAIKAKYHKRRAAQQQVGGLFTGKQLLEMFDKQNGKCIYCKCKLIKSGKSKYHADNIMPLSKGGSNDITNIQLLCPTCNLSKRDKLPEEFAQQFGMLV